MYVTLPFDKQRSNENNTRGWKGKNSSGEVLLSPELRLVFTAVRKIPHGVRNLSRTWLTWRETIAGTKEAHWKVIRFVTECAHVTWISTVARVAVSGHVRCPRGARSPITRRNFASGKDSPFRNNEDDLISLNSNLIACAIIIVLIEVARNDGDPEK